MVKVKRNGYFGKFGVKLAVGNPIHLLGRHQNLICNQHTN